MIIGCLDPWGYCFESSTLYIRQPDASIRVSTKEYGSRSRIATVDQGTSPLPHTAPTSKPRTPKPKAKIPKP